jgi:SpoVK/Ycf46/Vps4 family AAA+-type ATPase
MWVGGTEQNIADMFRQAAVDGALLLLDEADSFLQDRRRAFSSWEVTQVNELLTQMECFDGLFVCATNCMESFDPAVLRRFHFKVRFDYLTREQRERHFVAVLRELGCLIDTELPENLRSDLSRLTNLTPGDFASVVERIRISGVNSSPEQFLCELRKEAYLKPGGRRTRPGFIV